MVRKAQKLVKATEEAYRQVAAKSKPGEGGRFKALTKAISARGGVENPEALSAVIGKKKWGAKKMAKWAAAGRRKG